MKRNLLLGSVIVGVLTAAVSLTYAHSRHHRHHHDGGLGYRDYILKPIDAYGYFRPQHHASHDVAHPANIFKPYCTGGFDECGYDSIRNHSDGNPN